MTHKTSRILSFCFAAAIAAVASSSFAAGTYYWVGGSSGDWWTASNWSPSPSKWANGDTVYFTSDTTVFYDKNTDRNDTYFYHYSYASNCTVTVTSKAADGTYFKMVPNSTAVLDGGKWIFDNVFIAQRANNLVMGSAFSFAEGSSNIVSAANKDVSMSCDLSGDFTIDAQGGNAFNVYGDISSFSGKFISNETKSNRGVVFGSGSSDTSMAGSADATFVVNEGAFMHFNVANSVQFQIGELLGSGGICGDNRNASGESFRLYIGGKNTDFEANAAAIRITASSKAMDVSKVGTGAMAYNLNGIRDLYVDAGSVVITNSSRLPSGNIAFCGGKASDSAGVPLVDVSSKIKNSTGAIDIDVSGAATFATALANNNMGGLVKRGNGTLTLSAVPAYVGTTTLAGGVLVVPQDTTIAELACEGGKLTVLFTSTEENTPVLAVTSLAAGTTLADLQDAVDVVGLSTTVEATESGYVVKATRAPQTYIWTGAVDTNWATPGNWQTGGFVPATAPTAMDTVVFPELEENAPAWQVALSSVPTVTNVTANGAVTFTGALIRTEVVEGAATITLGDGAGFRTYDYLDAMMTISANIEANGSAEHPNEIRGYYTTKGGAPDKGGTSITFTGNLTGTGTLKIIGCRCSNALSGDYTGFAGHLWVVSDGVGRNKTYLGSASTTSSNAVWTVYNDSSDGKFLRFAGQTAYFGALNGTVYQSTTYYNNIFEIGAANVDCAFDGKIGATQQNHITKVGTATLTFKGSEMGNLVVKGGVFAAQNAQSMPRTSITFAGEGGFFDPVTNTVDFADKIVYSTEAPIGLLITNDVSIGEIPASNTAGLTKKGAGTLTLTEVPLYTGLTTVEEGTLVVPLGSALVVNALSAGTLNGATVTKYAYAANTALTAPATSGSVAYDAPLDISNVASVDASGIALSKGQIYVVASATDMVGYTKASLAQVELTLPDGADAKKWVLKVLTIDGRRCLCVAPPTHPTRIVLR